MAVAESGSLTAAANMLNISQPTIGRHINALEVAIGGPVFVRSRAGMQLNNAGLSLLDEARAMQREADLFAVKAAGHESAISGTVRITASDIVATYLLPPLLAALGRNEPQIQIELVSTNAVENLLSRDADIAVRMVRPTQNDLIARKANTLTMGAWAHQDYISTFGKPTLLDELFDHQIIGYDRNDMILQVMAGLGIKGNREMFAYRTDDQVANWELVKAGAGIGFGAHYLASMAPELSQVVPQLEIPSLPMWLTSHSELKTNRRIRYAFDFLYEGLNGLKL